MAEAEDKSQQISKKVPRRFLSILSVAAAAVLVLALMPMLLSYHISDTERNKRGSEFPVINLSAFAVQANGELQSIGGIQAPGNTVVFKVDIAQPYAIALAMSKGNGRPEVRYRAGTLKPGIGQLLQAEGRRFGYQLKSADKQISFCAIAADNESRLSQKIRLLTRIWANLPGASCVQLGVR